ncbi:Nuclear factor 7, ovary [Triplophysa tibetana]|uniref:Nuclear factor 7, ovary n=1 Tax=Triplophysa tibetana TaxID=1572043 RepID=A0A5A9P6X9_9TELE|nr:Nuclear factor 7, ovary [Triplophysa tibetana]
MASKRPFSEEDFTCPVCCDIFKDPVLLKCSHSVCRNCIQQYWTVKPSRECPLCRKKSNKNLTVNLALKNLCQTFVDFRGPPEELCEVHRERLSLFCLCDEQLVCVVCRESREHKTHTCRPVNEVAEERKSDFQRELNLLTRKMKIIEYAKFECHQQAEHIPHQLRDTENVIKNEFKHLHQLLNDEEKAMLAALNKEKQQKTKLINNNIKKMNDEVSSLLTTISIMRDYLAAPVVLDPNTANSQLILSEDLTSLRVRDEEDVAGMHRKKLPANPERFDRYPCVLGSVGYSSGTHVWDVDVGDGIFWMVGVTVESVQRKKINSLPSEVWCITYDGEMLSFKAPRESCIPLLGCERPKQVRVKLDLDKRKLSFSDRLSKKLYRINVTSFTEKVFPFFCSLSSVSPLWILPVVEPCS